MTWTTIITILFCNVLSAGLCFILTRKRNSSPLGISPIVWFLVAIPLGVIALFVMLALPDTPTEPEKQKIPRADADPASRPNSLP